MELRGPICSHLGRRPALQRRHLVSALRLPATVPQCKFHPERKGVHSSPKRFHAATSCSAATLSDLSIQGPQIHSADFKEGTYTVRGSMLASISAEGVYAILTDYANLENVFSNVKSSNTVETDGEKQLHQVCTWKFLVFTGDFRIVMSVQETQEGSPFELVFRLVRSGFMKEFEGVWRVYPLENGGCDIQHQLSVQPRIAPPPAFSGYAKKIFKKQVEAILLDLEGSIANYSNGL